ncbi:MAG TPA: class I SAM-dependent methyltransferase [Nitrospira sp.]|nr:class I SAM-dependent methyltransferase [Nitrospira sp.]
MTVTEKQVEASQAVYSKSMLAIYDWLVLRFSNRLIWKCPSKQILALYDRHVTANHLDVGVGTGYFLDRCRVLNDRTRLGLMDVNPNCLEAAARRAARYYPEVYRANVLDPIGLDIPRFDSISMTYLLHCLPGTIKTKSAVFRHLTPLLNHGGVMFGATVLSDGVHKCWAAKRLMAFYNSKGIFTNNGDDLQGLRAVLSDHFTAVSIEVVGCAALFSGRV